MKNLLTPEIKTLFHIFHTHGFQLYLVGGCVRDSLLNRPVHDFDMTTNALPSQMEEIATLHNIHYIPTGIKHGTITMIINHQSFEITTFRLDNDYKNHRHPNSVTFSSSLKDDIERRDFTINALCMNENTIIDYCNGQEDLNNKLIRCVGNPDTRFKEDALRILRCIRFAFELHFKIEKNTYEALKNNAHLLQYISQERIRDELSKILMSNHKNILIILKDSGILDVILPEYQMTYDLAQETPYHIYDVFHHMNAVLNNSIQAPLNIKLALLLHDLEKTNYKTIDENGIAHFKQHAHASALLSKKILKRLKFDNKTIHDVFMYIDYHDYYLTTSLKTIRKFLYKLKGDFTMAYAIMEVQKYDNMGKNPIITIEKNNIIDEVVSIMKTMEKQHECFDVKDLKINGHDLLKLGYKGKEIKIALDYLLRYVLNQQDKNNQTYLIQYAGGHKNEIISSK